MATNNQNSKDLRQLTPGRNLYTTTGRNINQAQSGDGYTYFNYNLHDINWNNGSFKNRYDQSGEVGRKVPVLEITEFQPNLLYNYGDSLQNIFSGVGAGFLSFATGSNKSKVPFSDTALGISQGVSRVGGEFAIEQKINNIAASRSNAASEILGTPIDIISKLLSGFPVGTFEVPFFEPHFLEVSTNSKDWTKSGLQAIIGSKVGKFVEDNLPFDIPGIPEWKSPEGGGPLPSINFKLMLYNNDFDALKKNFKFLSSFISGSFWMQLSYLKKSSNVYHVHCPGRFNYLFCSMDVSINYSGMVRTLTNKAESSLMNFFPGLQNIEKKPLFPDAYELDVSFTSLLPNNYNVFINYILNGIRDSKGNILNNQKIDEATGEKFVKGAKDILKGGASAVTNAVQNGTFLDTFSSGGLPNIQNNINLFGS